VAVARLNLNTITQWITATALRRPESLDLELATRTGVSRRTARAALARLVELNWLVRDGSARHPRWHPGTMRQVVQRYALTGLEEDTPWALDFGPCFALPAELRRMVQHSFCELLNNAIDHSSGSHVTVSLRQTATQVQLLVSDNGLGLFRRIAETFSIASPALAMLELSKGKLTSQPQRHTGQGLFFTAKLADVFDLRANDAAFQQRGWDDKGWQPQRGLSQTGTSAYAAFALDTPRTLDGVRQAHSMDGLGADFERTQVPLRLMTSSIEGLESRAQARRVRARLGEFRHADVDFSGVATIGHAFADELFRVLAPSQPGLALVPVNMTPAVAALVASVRRSASRPHVAQPQAAR
jgi:anti-sigma regulatory factor (Ser/Thr protein kinase)